MEKGPAERLQRDIFQVSHQVLVFYLSILLLFAGEVLLLVLSLPFLFHSALFAGAISLLLLTCFSFMILRNYLHITWKEKSQKAGRAFLSSLKNSHHEDQKIEGLLAFFRKLQGHTPSIKYLPAYLTSALYRLILRKELSPIFVELLKTAEKCAEEWVISSPLSEEAHGAFVEIHKAVAEEYRFFHLEKEARQEEAKAIEELLILRDIAPEERWVLCELTKLYRKAGRIEEELALYQEWLSMDPHQEDLQVTLAKLFFEQGKKSQGFRLYHDLRQNNPKKADELLTTLFDCQEV